MSSNDLQAIGSDLQGDEDPIYEPCQLLASLRLFRFVSAIDPALRYTILQLRQPRDETLDFVLNVLAFLARIRWWSREVT